VTYTHKTAIRLEVCFAILEPNLNPATATKPMGKPIRDSTGTDALSIQMRNASKRAHSASNALVNARFVGLLADAKVFARALGCAYIIHREIEHQLDIAVQSDAREFWQQMPVTNPDTHLLTVLVADDKARECAHPP
jgi:hypothetical protein